MAREFVQLTIGAEKMEEAAKSEESCKNILLNLEPSPEHFFWFEYNFLYVFAADGFTRKKGTWRPFTKGLPAKKKILFNK